MFRIAINNITYKGELNNMDMTLKDCISELPNNTRITLFGKGYRFITCGTVKWLKLDIELNMRVTDIITNENGEIHYFLSEY